MTPFEVVFGAERFASREFPAVEEEAHERALGLLRLQEFALIGHVGLLLGELVPDESDPAALGRYLSILFHGFHFWRVGCRIYAFDAPVVRSLVEFGPDLKSWRPQTPALAFYIELPRNLFWASVGEGQPPEPVDGMFVTAESDPPAGLADVLVVLGMRPDRPGFSVVELTADLEAPLRAQHPDTSFRSDIPGAELAGLYSLERASEAVLLLVRLLWYLDVYPASTEFVRGASDREPGSSTSGEGTLLDHYRVSFVERSAG